MSKAGALLLGYKRAPGPRTFSKVLENKRERARGAEAAAVEAREGG